MSIAENLAQIRKRIAEICARLGRSTDSVRLVAVSKTKSVSDVMEAYTEGQRDFGENYIQEAISKIEATAHLPIHWHMIGHLQTNKAKYAAKMFDMIQTIDSIKLAQELDKRAKAAGRIIPVMIEVNVGDEASKSGCAPDQVHSLSIEILRLDSLDLKGLMAMPPYLSPEEERPFFSLMAKLREKVIAFGIPESNIKELSMGLSHDFEVAIEEGATMVRIGTAIFGAR